VAAPSGAEVKGALDRAEAESAQARERARKELDALGGGPAGEKRR
jgi:hypothetical protein